MLAALALALAILAAMPGSGSSEEPRALPASPALTARRVLPAPRLLSARPSRRVAVSGAAQPRAKPKPRPKRIYWGAWIGNQLTGVEAPWDMNAVTKFAQLTGKGLSLIHFSAPFADCRRGSCIPYIFPVQAFDNIRNYGAIPFFSWGSDAQPIIKKTSPQYTLHTIIAGQHDAFIKAWATAAKQWGHPFFLEFDWEMNGSWFPWSEGVNGNRPGEFVKAWRHVHDVFAKVGATNVTWVWCPNADPVGVFAPIYPLYPGSAYVDWTCLNVYNLDRPWMTFDTLFRSTYNLVRQFAPTKPIIISEIASTERGGSKAAWITNFLTNLPTRYPLVRGFTWFEKFDSGYDWPVETSTSSRLAFARAIKSSVYAANVFDALPSGRIRPPS